MRYDEPNDDLQSLRVYDAEDAFARCPIGLSQREMQNYLNVVLRDPLWEHKWRKKKLRVIMASKNIRHTYALIDRKTPCIIMGRSNGHRSQHLILHELAHLLVPWDTTHDERWCNMLLHLIEKYDAPTGLKFSTNDSVKLAL